MFDNFQEITGKPNNLNKGKYNPVIPRPEIAVPVNPFQDEAGNIIWSYGDTISIDFEIEGMVKSRTPGEKSGVWTPIVEFLNNKLITVELLNSRNEIKYRKQYNNINNSKGVITFALEPEESKEIIQGSYTLRIKINSLGEVDNNIIKNLLTINNGVLVQ